MYTRVIRVSTATAKQRLSEIINQVAYGGRRVVITSRGNPKVALVGLDDLERLGVPRSMLRTTKKEVRLKALALADEVRNGISRNNQIKRPDPVEELHRMRQERDQQLSNDLH